VVQLGPYELLEPIGRGGMADLYLARRRGPGGVEKRLVVKRIRRERAADARFLRMFVEEARLGMSLAHQNLVAVFDFGRAGDELFLVMEHVDGSDLGAALGRAQKAVLPPSPLVVAFIALETCRGLAHAHRAGDRPGIVHRDVTPKNVLLSTSGEVKLADFGVALQQTDLGSAGVVRGTPAYMAPEQARGEAVDARADLFSLGLVVWESLAGRRAYEGDATAEVLERARRGKVEPLPAGVPPALAAVVSRATRADVELRYQTADELAGDLDDFIVATRAATAGPAPPSLLAGWLTSLFPTGVRGAADLRLRRPEGHVVTFREDGVGKIAKTEEAPPTDSGEQTVAASSGVPHRRLIAVGALLAVLLAVALGTALRRSTDETRAAPTQAATPANANVMSAAPAVDATAPAPADATAPSPPIDGGAAEKPVARTAPADRRERAEPDRKKITEPTPAPSAALGQVRISTRPWSRVTVRGHDAVCEETPCTLSLPPGDYSLYLENPIADRHAEVEVTVEAGRTSTVMRSLHPR
jgi:serine/threonine protein kinase